ncbi:TrbC/VirB2 family protein [Sinorhizobium fredii]|uniref:TrbC/VirB2 family protein n=1 Tax=Rhizobium fredii TaxID=380 RepID=UPI00351834F4
MCCISTKGVETMASLKGKFLKTCNDGILKAYTYAITRDREQVAKALTIAACAVGAGILVAEPALAQTLESIDNAATTVDSWIGGTFAKTVAGIALAGTGFAALFNRLSWFWFGACLLGIAIIFGRKQIVEIFASGA